MKVYIFLVYFLVLTNTACSKSLPVMVGGDKIHDACGSGAQTISSTIKKMKVYSAPDINSKVIDVISTRIYVSVCDFSGDSLIGEWVGIVYSADGSLRCGVGSPIKRRQPYKGACKSGWVKRVTLNNWIG